VRPLEIALIVVLALRILWPPFATRRPNWSDALPAIGLLIILFHLALEGYRWQMLPLYVIDLILLAFSVRNLMRPAPLAHTGSAFGRRIAASAFGLAGLLLASALPSLLPVPQPPIPTGSYPIGTVNLSLVDSGRKEIYSSNPDDPRAFLAQIWYPAAASPGCKPAPWLDHMDVMSPAIAGELQLPGFFLSHLALVRGHACADAPLAQAGEPFPVLLFSHGWNGFRTQNTYQFEELASHGYVVVALQHPYGAPATVFPDGRVAYNNPAALPTGAPAGQLAAAGNKLVDQWAGDLAYTLDYLKQVNTSDPAGRFTGRLDLDKVGVFGHSTGGGATVEFCSRDPRCKAALGLDAYLQPVSPAVLQKGLSQPALFLFSQLWPTQLNNDLFAELQKNKHNNFQGFTLLGSGHYDFSDLPMLTPLAPMLGLKGPINGPRALRIINDYTLAFFDKYLKGTPEPLLDGTQSEEYPEIVPK
jgi:dienelactone hydrolase